jgi:hypothetical protein
VPDEQARVAALRAGAIGGATLSVDVARTRERQRPRRPEGAERRVPRAADDPQAGRANRGRPARAARGQHAINAPTSSAGHSGEGEYSGHVPPGYGPWPLTDAELKQKYEKFDLVKAKKLMADAGLSKGFSVTMTTFAQQDYPQISAVVQSQLKRINIDVNIVAQEGGTFAANNGAGGSTGISPAAARRRLLAEFHPAAPVYKIWYRVQKRQGVARDRRPDPARPRQAPPDLQGGTERLLLNPVQIRSSRSSTRSCASASRACTAFNDFNTGLRTVWLNR